MKADQRPTQGHIPGEWSSHTWPPEFLAMSLWFLAYLSLPGCVHSQPAPRPYYSVLQQGDDVSMRVKAPGMRRVSGPSKLLTLRLSPHPSSGGL